MVAPLKCCGHCFFFFCSWPLPHTTSNHHWNIHHPRNQFRILHPVNQFIGTLLPKSPKHVPHLHLPGTTTILLLNPLRLLWCLQRVYRNVGLAIKFKRKLLRPNFPYTLWLQCLTSSYVSLRVIGYPILHPPLFPRNPDSVQFGHREKTKLHRVMFVSWTSSAVHRQSDKSIINKAFWHWISLSGQIDLSPKTNPLRETSNHQSPCQ